MIKVGILTLSDKGGEGKRKDLSAQILRKICLNEECKVVKYANFPDEKDQIVEVLKTWVNEENLDLIITNSRTGIHPRNITPEATKEVIEKKIPGILEYIRYISYPLTPISALTRGIAGVRKNTLIINLPGSPKAIREIFSQLVSIIKLAIKKLKGDPHECARN